MCSSLIDRNFPKVYQSPKIKKLRFLQALLFIGAGNRVRTDDIQLGRLFLRIILILSNLKISLNIRAVIDFD